MVLVRCGSRSQIEEGEQGSKGASGFFPGARQEAEGCPQVDRKAGLRWEGLLLGRKRQESVGASQEGGRYRQEGGLCRGRERLGAGIRAEEIGRHRFIWVVVGGEGLASGLYSPCKGSQWGCQKLGGDPAVRDG